MQRPVVSERIPDYHYIAMCVYQLTEALKGRGGGGGKILWHGSVVHATEVKFPIRFTEGNMRTTTFFKSTPFLAFFAIFFTHEAVLVSEQSTRMRCNFCSVRTVRSKKIKEVCKTGRQLSSGLNR
jgi:hypothetical protein